jgi:hypothetical protein
MSERHYIEGDLYLSLEIVAEIYQVEVLWLREVYEFGLLGRGVSAGTVIRIQAVQLDRVATIVRWHHNLGLDVEAIALALNDAG